MNIHHEETVINNILHYRKSFNESFIPYTQEELTQIIHISRDNSIKIDKNKIIRTEPRMVSEGISFNFIKYVKRLFNVL